MNAIIGIDSARSSAWFKYTCPECGWEMESDGNGHLIHPSVETGFLLGKDKPIKCSYSGKVFKEPIQTIELQPV